MRFNTLIERFESKFEPIPWTGCWEWCSTFNGNGYGILGIGHSKLILAHRLAWELYKGPVPDGLCVLHDCPSGDNRSCVNPDHLWLGTRGDNLRDMARKGRGTSGSLPRGVSKNHNRFFARVKHMGKMLYLGNYGTAEEAGLVAAKERARLLEASK